MINKTDEQLVQMYKSGEVETFNELYKRYKNVVLSYAHSVYCIGADLEDVIQEGMLGLLKAIQYYNGKASFKNFAFTCIRTNILNATSRCFSNKNLPLNNTVSISETEYELKVSDENLEDNFIFKETVENLFKKAEQNLSDFEKEVLKLFLEGFSYTEIGEKLNCSPKQCDNALQRVRKKLTEEDI